MGRMASYACRIISVLNDKITRKVITLTENELRPPRPRMHGWAWEAKGDRNRRF